MSNIVMFECHAAKYLWRFEIVTWQGRESFRVWPYYNKDGAWLSCKAEYVRDALQMSLDDFAGLRVALAKYDSGTIKLAA